MSYPGAVLTVTTDIHLVVLSILVSVIGSYIALDMAQQILFAQGNARRWWLIGSGLTLGITIWAMHFIATLGYRLMMPVSYEFAILLLSMIVAIAAALIGFCIISRQEQVSLISLSAASIFIGSGIIGMHFTAMSSLRLGAVLSYEPKLIVLSGAVAISFSFGALWFKLCTPNAAFLSESRRLIGSALLMGIAISGMHYIAMAAVRFQSAPLTQLNLSAIDNSLLAVVIGIAALMLLKLALLASVFARRLSAELATTEILRQTEERLEQLVQQRTEELEREKLISEAANRAKSEFLANMSHELRTPLANIINISDLLNEQLLGPLNAKQQQFVNSISTCGYELLNLLNDLLDLSKIEAGREELVLEAVSIEEICQECLSSIQEQANSKGLQLSLEIAPDLTTCTADRRRLKQIFLNLLSNALKFTDAGSITLKVDKESNYFRFAVIDTGIGISVSEQAKLFQPFQQLDSGLNRKYMGTGLGLALSRNLAHLHGGDITVESELGRGSCFTLLLPETTSDRLD